MSKLIGVHVPDGIKNYIINGDMRISQRGTTFTGVTTNGTYTLDRWRWTSAATTAVHTITQDTDVPTFAQAGYFFQNSLRLNLTTADTSIAAADSVLEEQVIEGYNFANIAQKTFTLSFWVKATLAGIYCVAFRNTGADRSYVAEYTISGSNTWEYKTITVTPSPTAGTWNYTNGVGLRVGFTLAGGSTLLTTPGSWQTGNFVATTNQVNGVNTGATDFRITGVMVSEGPLVVVPFKMFSEDEEGELSACQRYYEKTYNQGTAPGTATTTGAIIFRPAATGTWTETVTHRVLKRISGSPVVYNTNSGATGSFRDNSGAADKAMGISVTEWGVNLESSVSLAAGNQHTGHWTVDAEL